MTHSQATSVGAAPPATPAAAASGQVLAAAAAWQVAVTAMVLSRPSLVATAAAPGVWPWPIARGAAVPVH